jgi:hypothetical protein
MDRKSLETDLIDREIELYSFIYSFVDLVDEIIHCNLHNCFFVVHFEAVVSLSSLLHRKCSEWIYSVR